MNTTKLLETLGENINLDLALSEHKTCSVIFDEDEVIFEENNNQLFIYAVLGTSIGHEELYEDLLSYSNLGANTGNASIGLDKDRNEFLMYRILTGNMEYEEFQDILVLFIKSLRYWKNWLSNPAKPDNQFSNDDSQTAMDLLKDGHLV